MNILLKWYEFAVNALRVFLYSEQLRLCTDAEATAVLLECIVETYISLCKPNLAHNSFVN